MGYEYDDVFIFDGEYNPNPEFANLVNSSLTYLTDENIRTIEEEMQKTMVELGLDTQEVEVNLSQNEILEAPNKDDAEAARLRVNNVLETIYEEKDPIERDKKKELLVAIMQVAKNENSSQEELKQSKIIFEEYINISNEDGKKYEYERFRKDLNIIDQYREKQRRQDLEI